jgi:hypothetical protein
MLLRFALTVLILATTMPPALAQIGTAAAVNQSAQGRPPGGAIRTIALGDNIILNERITTNDAGLVQILFADGTTLMLGPRSDLVIDSFFYDPAAKEAKLAATMTKGALRFIGGLVSKKPDSAQITTPVGTIGIRGAITDIVLDPPDGTPQHVSMHFGSEVTLARGIEIVQRLYEAGYSLVMQRNGTVGIQKTPPEWSSQIQKALAGAPGTTGGSANPPTNETVANSGVPEGNSLRLNIDPKADPLPLTVTEIEDLIDAVANFEELREFFSPRVAVGPTAALFQFRTVDINGNVLSKAYMPASTTGTQLASATLTSLLFDTEGRPIAGTLDITLRNNAFCFSGTCRWEATISPDGSFAQHGGQTFDISDLPGVTFELAAPKDMNLPTDIALCECAFMDWAFWEARQFGELIFGGVSAVADRYTSTSELDTPGAQELVGTQATYSGHVAGYVGMDDQPAVVDTGGFDMVWSFGDREGEVEISDFNNMDFTGAILGDAGLASFAGPLDGTDATGGIRGLFVNNGSVPAAGVLGDFTIEGDEWNGAGIFMGTRGPDQQNN